MEDDEKLDWTHITLMVFTWVIAGLVFNLALYALGFVGVSFTTLLASIAILYVPCYLIIQGVEEVIGNIQINIKSVPSEDDDVKEESGE